MPSDAGDTPIPTDRLDAPARRTLAGAGYTTGELLAETNEAAVGGLHGTGPNALKTLREAPKATTWRLGEIGNEERITCQ